MYLHNLAVWVQHHPCLPQAESNDSQHLAKRGHQSEKKQKNMISKSNAVRSWNSLKAWHHSTLLNDERGETHPAKRQVSSVNDSMCFHVTWNRDMKWPVVVQLGESTGADWWRPKKIKTKVAASYPIGLGTPSHLITFGEFAAQTSGLSSSCPARI